MFGNSSDKIVNTPNEMLSHDDGDDENTETVIFEPVTKTIDDVGYLEKVDYKSTIEFVPPISLCKVIKVYDGDTITVAARLPNSIGPIYRFQVRLLGIDTAEIKGGSANETIIAKQTRAALSELIFGKIVKLKNCHNEKYGRILADVYLDDMHVNKWLIDNNYAVEYDGGKKHKPTAWD
jgi:endonuclease YncB( thermonuclease family)